MYTCEHIHSCTIAIFLEGLDEQFTKYKCILDHMVEFKDKQKYIFSNYIVMFSHVFTGLEYLHSKNIIHGDVKGCITVRI